MNISTFGDDQRWKRVGVQKRFLQQPRQFLLPWSDQSGGFLTWRGDDENDDGDDNTVFMINDFKIKTDNPIPIKHKSNFNCCQGSTKYSILPSQMGEHGVIREKHGEIGRDGKHQTDDFKHSTYDSKHHICDKKTLYLATEGLKTLYFLVFLVTVEEIFTFALGEHDPWSVQAGRTSSEIQSPGSCIQLLTR